jgi:hypothetical protein
LSFAEERIEPLAAIITTVFYLLGLYLFALPNSPENPFASIYSETLIKTTCQHLLLLVGFDTLIYRKYYDTPPILVGHQAALGFALVVTCRDNAGALSNLITIPTNLDQNIYSEGVDGGVRGALSNQFQSLRTIRLDGELDSHQVID